MGNEDTPLPKEKNRLEELQEAINNAPGSIEEEFRRTVNPWLSCFGSSLFVVETYLSSKKVQVLVSPKKYEQANQNLEALKERFFELKKQYPDKSTVPPEEIRQELLNKLDIFKEEKQVG